MSDDSCHAVEFLHRGLTCFQPRGPDLDSSLCMAPLTLTLIVLPKQIQVHMIFPFHLNDSELVKHRASVEACSGAFTLGFPLLTGQFQRTIFTILRENKQQHRLFCFTDQASSRWFPHNMRTKKQYGVPRSRISCWTIFRERSFILTLPLRTRRGIQK